MQDKSGPGSPDCTERSDALSHLAGLAAPVQYAGHLQTHGTADTVGAWASGSMVGRTAIRQAACMPGGGDDRGPFNPFRHRNPVLRNGVCGGAASRTAAGSARAAKAARPRLGQRSGHLHAARHQLRGLCGDAAQRRLADRPEGRTACPLGSHLRPIHHQRRVVAAVHRHVCTHRLLAPGDEYVVPVEPGPARRTAARHLWAHRRVSADGLRGQSCSASWFTPALRIMAPTPSSARAHRGAIFGIAGALILLLSSRFLPLAPADRKSLRKSVIWFGVC